MTMLPIDNCSSSADGQRPKVLFLDSIKLATAEAKAFNKIATVIVSQRREDSTTTLSFHDHQPNTSTSRSSFLGDLETKYKDVTAIYRHFKASESIKASVS